MKRLILVSMTVLLTSALLCADVLAQKKSTKVTSNRAIQLSPGSADRWFTDGRYVTVPHAAKVNRDIRSAQLGDAAAQFRLALRYDSGSGVLQNHAEAVKWLRRSADQGFAEAEYNLGSMYDRGLGVPQDFSEATRWYRQAAEHGFASAQMNLGAKYGRGEGVPRNRAEAYVWSSVAVMSGNKNAINNRDTAASMLSAEELDIAQKRAAALYEEIHQKMEGG